MSGHGVHVVLQIVAAWQAHGLCHGDIKPENVVVDSSGAMPIVCLIDIEGVVALPSRRVVWGAWPMHAHTLRRDMMPTLSAGGSHDGSPGSGRPGGGFTGSSLQLVTTETATRTEDEVPAIPMAKLPSPLRVYTDAFVKPSASGVVLALFTTDWYALGVTLARMCDAMHTAGADKVRSCSSAANIAQMHASADELLPVCGLAGYERRSGRSVRCRQAGVGPAVGCREQSRARMRCVLWLS
jgi:serine/threonine protein kinase